MQRSIVLFDIVSICSDSVNDKRNLSPPKKTMLVPKAKLFLNPATNLLSTPATKIILAELRNKSEGS